MVKKESINKNLILKKVQEELKKKFHGIDNQIDDLIDLIRPWYLNPDLFQHPYVINIWGITSVGKTALVKEIVNSLNIENRFFYFNLGYEYSKEDAKKFLIEEFKTENKAPGILCFDEIHLAVSKFEEHQNDIESPGKILWEILGEGKIQIRVNKYDLQSLKNYVDFLTDLIYSGVNVKKGVVLIPKDEYDYLHEENGFVYEGWRNKTSFVSRFHLDSLSDEIYYIFGSMNLFYKELFNLNGIETVNFLNKLINKLENNLELNCSNYLIFNIGNIDEVYQSTELQNYAFDADYLHNISKHTTIYEIKSFLEERFRDEQIARLGSNHLIFPTLSEKAFEKIISSQLKCISSKIYNDYKIKLDFDKSVFKYLIKYFADPLKGVRPIHSCINSIINSFILTTIAERTDYKFDLIKISVCNSVFNAEIFSSGISMEIVTKEFDFFSKKNIKPDYESISMKSVHVAGHFIINYLLFENIPEILSLESNVHSIIENSFPSNKYYQKSKLSKIVSVLYGGFFAEKLVFGEENISNYSYSDITLATKLTKKMINECGFGIYPINYEVLGLLINPDNDIPTNFEIEKYIEKFLIDASTYCEKSLKKHYQELITISEKLIKKEKMFANELSELMNNIKIKRKLLDE